MDVGSIYMNGTWYEVVEMNVVGRDLLCFTNSRSKAIFSNVLSQL